MTFSRSAISDTVHLYALAIRRGDADAAAALFAADGAFEVREGEPAHPAAAAVLARAEGREGVRAYVSGSIARAHMLPMIHNLIVTPGENGEVASASSLMVGRMWPSGREVIGEYADRLVCEGGEWRFSLRIYTIYRAA